MSIKYSFKNLVFQGGGIKTFAYHGALEVLEEQQVLHQIERVAGTSAGAPLAMLLSFRLSAQETIQILRSIDYAKIPGTNAKLPDWARRVPLAEEQIAALMQRMDRLNRLYRNYGWFALDYAYHWVMDMIAQHCHGNGRATFEDFRKLGYRDLHILAANLSRHRAVNFCADEPPHVAVADAVLMSATLPLFFEALQFDGAQFGKGEYYADGGWSPTSPSTCSTRPNMPKATPTSSTASTGKHSAAGFTVRRTAPRSPGR